MPNCQMPQGHPTHCGCEQTLKPSTYLVRVNGRRVHEGSRSSCEDWALAWNSSVSPEAGVARLHPLYERPQPAPIVPPGATHCTEFGWYKVSPERVLFWSGSQWALSDFKVGEITERPGKFYPIAPVTREVCGITVVEDPTLGPNELKAGDVAPIAQTEQQPLVFINPMVVDELEGRRKPSPGGLTWSRKACAHWTFPLYAAPIAQTAPQHPDDAAVDRFAAAMKAKLAKSRAKGRGGWDDPNVCSVEFLAQLLVEHLGKGNAGTFEDVANFAMMLHQRGADPKVLAEAAEAPIKKARGEALELGVRALESKTAPQPEQSGLVEALADAAQSLETISNGAGKDEFMQDMADVRGYARSRAGAARAALSAKGDE